MLAQLDEFGPKFIKRWRSDLVILNLGYSLVSVCNRLTRVRAPGRSTLPLKARKGAAHGAGMLCAPRTQGLLRSLLRQSSVAAHMRRVENPPPPPVDPDKEFDAFEEDQVTEHQHAEHP